MTKGELINALLEENGLTKKEATEIIKIFFEEISNTLAKGDRVEIRGLCSIYVKKYKAYTGRNPKTGKKVNVKTKKLPYFKAGRELKKRVDK